MKKISKFLSIILALLMVISIVPITASAATYSGYCGDNVTWSYNTSNYTLTISGTGKMYDYYVSVYEDYRPWATYVDNIKKVIINDGVTSIGACAFSSCYWLTSASMPNSLLSIGDEAFFGTNLTNITIPNKVTTIGNNAFNGCYSVTSVKIPSSVKAIGNLAFGSCSSIKNFTVDNDNKFYSNDDYGVLFNKDKTTLVQYPIGNTRKTYSIPNGVIKIGSYAFFYCDHITSIVIPNTVDHIDQFAFGYCLSLTNITIPKSVTTIGDCSFSACDELVDVYFNGTKSEWNKIVIGEYNDELINAKIHYHVHDYDVVVTPVTCTQDGYTTYTCDCGDTYIKNVITATGHKDSDSDAHCDNCDELLCNHSCHKGGISGFFWKITLFFSRLFGSNKTCACGVAHY